MSNRFLLEIRIERTAQDDSSLFCLIVLITALVKPMYELNINALRTVMFLAICTAAKITASASGLCENSDVV